MKKLGDAVWDIVGDLKQCGLATKHILSIGGMALAFSNPVSFAFHIGKDLIVNGVQIYKEMNDSVV